MIPSSSLLQVLAVLWIAGHAPTLTASEPRAGTTPTGTVVLAASDEPGTPLVVSGTVRDENGEPIEGAELLFYHTDRRGWYTLDKVMDEPHARLRGRVRTGPDGKYELRTIRPGAYPATEETPESRRIPEHIHYEVSAPGYALERFQLVFEDDSRMTPYWYEWARKGRNPVAPVEKHDDGSQSCVVDITLRRQ